MKRTDKKTRRRGDAEKKTGRLGDGETGRRKKSRRGNAEARRKTPNGKPFGLSSLSQDAKKSASQSDTVAIITLSAEGAKVAAELAQKLSQGFARRGYVPNVELFVHTSVAKSGNRPWFFKDAHSFDRVTELTAELFSRCRGSSPRLSFLSQSPRPPVSQSSSPRLALVFVAPCGVAVRAIAPHIQNKLNDPAVVVVDIGGRWALSLLSGHEGGANRLAVDVANALGAEPIITTTTEAAKRVIVGVGCRRGVSGRRIVQAIQAALKRGQRTIDQVRLLASADVKAREPGLHDAARRLGVPLVFIGSDEIRASARGFAKSEFVQRSVGLPAVAEPAALLAGRRTRLLLSRQTFPGVTVALAEESCTWWASGPAGRPIAPPPPSPPSPKAR